jgi:hypothetical protein
MVDAKRILRLAKNFRGKAEQFWRDLEKDVASRATKKDPKFKLDGKWKKFVRNQSGYKVFAVDGEWVRSNLSVVFGHGGHGWVHEFIPKNEIWIATHHPKEGCDCKLDKKGEAVSDEYFDSCTIHEITEINKMKKGMPYYKAHEIALKKEEEIALLPDPYDDREPKAK